MTSADAPLFFKVRQSFTRPRVEDLTEAVRRELETVLPAASLPKGAAIGVTVGSRGSVASRRSPGPQSTS